MIRSTTAFAFTLALSACTGASFVSNPDTPKRQGAGGESNAARSTDGDPNASTDDGAQGGRPGGSASPGGPGGSGANGNTPGSLGNGNGNGNGQGGPGGAGGSGGAGGPGNGSGLAHGNGGSISTNGGTSGNIGAGGDQKDGGSGGSNGGGGQTNGGVNGGSNGSGFPGVLVTKVGVNFEDTRNGDADYNDAVLCFAGNFAVDGANVVSTSVQTVIGTTYSHADCRHTVSVVIVAANGTKSAPYTYDSRQTQPVPMAFAVGSKLEVTMVSSSSGCDQGLVKSMHTAEDAQVAPNLCRQN